MLGEIKILLSFIWKLLDDFPEYSLVILVFAVAGIGGYLSKK